MAIYSNIMIDRYPPPPYDVIVGGGYANAWVFAIYTNIMIDRYPLPLYDAIVGGYVQPWVIDTCWLRDYDSSLFIVRVRTLRPDNGWLIAIYSKVLPMVQRSRSLSTDSVAKWRQGPKVTLSQYRPFPYYSNNIDCSFVFWSDNGLWLKSNYRTHDLGTTFSLHLFHFQTNIMNCKNIQKIFNFLDLRNF